MREIKFRAWLENEKRIVPVRSVGPTKQQFTVHFYELSGSKFPKRDRNFIKNLGTEVTFWFGENASGNSVMQFTGLKDKNGKEIYEGDVVEKRGRYRAPVTYEPAMFFFKTSGTDYQPLGLFGDNYEVIGNIYENPELLTPSPSQAQRQ